MRFLRDQGVTHVVADHMGAGMARMLATMGIPVVRPTDRDARASVLAAVEGTAPTS